MRAVVGPKPIPIYNADAPDWWLSYGIPVGSLIASFFAAMFAGLALKYIGRQIHIANAQTKIATDALTATHDAVRLAKQDLDATLIGLQATQKALAITIDQAEKADRDRAKEPKLVVIEQRTLPVDLEHWTEIDLIHAANNVSLDFYVTNMGDKTATNVTVEFLFEGFAQSGIATGDAIQIGASGYGKGSVEGDLAPREWKKVGVVHANVKPGKTVVRWIARCNEGAFPKGEYPNVQPWGELAFEFVSG